MMATTVGRVSEIWRYPVKSMGGERHQRCRITASGLVGDRGWALRDERAGEIRGAKKMPALLRCAARYVEEPGDGRIPAAEITLPDGARVRTDDPRAAELLSALVGRPVTLWPIQPKDARDHYRRALPDDPDFEKELRSIFGRLEDEPLPDLSVFSQEIFEFTSPLGTYFDAFPIHLVTTAWLAELSRKNPAARFDVRRFRPNFLIEPGDGARGLVESEWCGRSIRVGGATIAVEIPCVRCSMPTQPQADLAKDPSVLRTIVAETGQNVGVYASVVEPGEVRVGDPVLLG
jgi:hypothetical protein